MAAAARLDGVCWSRDVAFPNEIVGRGSGAREYWRWVGANASGSLAIAGESVTPTRRRQPCDNNSGLVSLRESAHEAEQCAQHAYPIGVLCELAWRCRPLGQWTAGCDCVGIGVRVSAGVDDSMALRQTSDRIKVTATLQLVPCP